MIYEMCRTEISILLIILTMRIIEKCSYRSCMSRYSAEHLASCCFVEETLRRDTEPNGELGVTKKQNVYKPNNASSRYIGPLNTVTVIPSGTVTRCSLLCDLTSWTTNTQRSRGGGKQSDTWHSPAPPGRAVLHSRCIIFPAQRHKQRKWKNC